MTMAAMNSYTTGSERCIYFCRSNRNYIPDVCTYKEAHTLMCKAFDFGTLTGDGLSGMTDLFSQVRQ